MTWNPLNGEHWRLESDAENVAWLTIDLAGSGTNVLSAPVLNELNRMLDAVEIRNPTGLIIRSGKKNGFIAGADIKEFTTFTDSAHAQREIHRAMPIFQRLEELPFPTVAMIHGFCLGGGLELALACRYRVAEDGADTRLGLPEVRLGIHPGFGGTVRLPRLIGHLPALGLMLTGRTLKTKQAWKTGIVDRIAPRRHLERGALALIHDPPRRKQPGFWSRLPGNPLLRPLVAAWLHRKTEARAPARDYPAPHALIDLWRRCGPAPVGSRFEQEAASVAKLITGRTAGNLIRLFGLQERLKSLGKKTDFKPQRVHVAGAGVMGGDIAAWCALNGLTVTLQDRNDTIIGRAIGRASKLFQMKLKDPLLVRDALDRLIPDSRGDGVAKADVVIEAIFENLEAKQKLLSDLEAKLKPGALLATNTSSICLEEIAKALKNPQRFIGLHFFNPVAKMPLLEVVAGSGSSPEAVDDGCAFGVAVKRSPLPVKSGPGFLINRILMPYLLEAVTLVAEGVAPKAVDRAAVTFGMPMGPIALADVVGLDICLSVAKNLADLHPHPIPKILQERVARNHLGRKSGRGFYTYDMAGRQGPSDIKGSTPPPETLIDRLFGVLLNEAAACLREGVVADADLLDAGVVLGTGYAPFRGGPMRTIEQCGRQELLQRLQELERRQGARFTPDPGWQSDPVHPTPANQEFIHEPESTHHHPTVAGPHVARLVSGARPGNTGIHRLPTVGSHA